MMHQCTAVNKRKLHKKFQEMLLNMQQCALEYIWRFCCHVQEYLHNIHQNHNYLQSHCNCHHIRSAVQITILITIFIIVITIIITIFIIVITIIITIFLIEITIQITIFIIKITILIIIEITILITIPGNVLVSQLKVVKWTNRETRPQVCSSSTWWPWSSSSPSSSSSPPSSSSSWPPPISQN